MSYSSKLIETRLVSIALDYGKAIKSVHVSGIIDDYNPFVTVVSVSITNISSYHNIERHDDNSP